MSVSDLQVRCMLDSFSNLFSPRNPRFQGAYLGTSIALFGKIVIDQHVMKDESWNSLLKDSYREPQGVGCCFPFLYVHKQQA